MALLELLNVEGDSQEDSATVTETWYCEYSDVASGYTLDYPAVGVPWSSDSSYICSSVKFNREAKKYYSADPSKSSHNGADVVTLQATYTLDRSAPQGEDPFTTKIASAGYQTFKINAGGTWGIINKPCGYEAGTYELKLPVLQIDKSIIIISDEPLDDVWYVPIVKDIKENNNYKKLQKISKNGKIKLYRGIKYRYKNPGAIESWTIDYDIALGFAKNNPKNVYIKEIPIKNVLTKINRNDLVRRILESARKAKKDISLSPEKVAYMKKLMILQIKNTIIKVI